MRNIIKTILFIVGAAALITAIVFLIPIAFTEIFDPAADWIIANFGELGFLFVILLVFFSISAVISEVITRQFFNTK